MAVCAACGRESPEEFAFCPTCGASLTATALRRDVRKVVTVLFCDLTGSTAIGEGTDPEALRMLMNRYYETARGALERHGGTVEKFVGDAVMAVFGIPLAREDDALRATRAAAELREIVHDIGLEARIGVNTGPVVAGEGDTLVTGDAVNVAARLEQLAGPGEILLGETTSRLVRDAVEGEPLELEVKGKTVPVRAHRLLALDRMAGGFARQLQRPMVGRVRERERLRADFADVAERGVCRLFTLIGPAGVGKSRLVHDFLVRVDRSATVTRGRALSYGEGITYWPLVEMLLQLGVEPAEVISSSRADTQLLTRALLEQWAEARPLVLVLDDLHWAEPPMLDLVEHVVDWSRERPIFVLCIARPELLDVRPGWGGGKLNATSVLLEPLSPNEATELATSLLENVEIDAPTRTRILDTAEGNPLFLEEMAALARHAHGTVEVPPTIQALLQARLDTLDDSERAVVDRGAVEGKVFHRGAVTALALEGQREDVPGRLPSLVRKEVVRPDRTQIPGDAAFRFRHLLIRDTAYESLPKAVRAELHERFADWLATRAELYEHAEILGYHLEQAARYRIELDPDDPRARDLSERAAAHLGSAGRAAFDREDLHATRSLLERAIELLPEGAERRRLFPYQLHTLSEGGDESLAQRLNELERGDELDRAVAVAFRIASDPVLSEAAAEHAQLNDAERVLDEAGDVMGAVFCETARAFLHWGAAHAGDAHRSYRRAYERLRRAQSPALRRWLVGNILFTAMLGTVHLDDMRRLLDELESETPNAGPLLSATLRSWRARIDYHAGVADLASVRPAIDEEILLLEQTGALVQAATAKNFLRKVVPFLEGDRDGLARGRREAVEETNRLWAELYGANELGNWALSFCEQNAPGEAVCVVEQARPLTRPNDVSDQILLDAAEAWARALQDEPDAARRLLERAHLFATDIDLAVSVDQLDHVDAIVQMLLGDSDRSRALLEGLVERNETRGRRRAADRYRRDLAALDGSP